MSIFVVIHTFASGNNSRKRESGRKNKDKPGEAEIICSFVRACNFGKLRNDNIAPHTSAVAGTDNSVHNSVPTTKKLNPQLIVSLSVTMTEKFLFVRRVVENVSFVTHG